MLRPFSAALAFALVFGAPGVPAYHAAAAIVTPAARAAPSPGWGGAVSSVLHRAVALPQTHLTPDVENALGQARLVLQQSPRSAVAASALAFVAHLPPALAPDPLAFEALGPAEQQAALAPAVAAASAEMQPRAEAFLRRIDERPLDSADRAELDALAAGWFYLTPLLGRAVRTRAADERARRTLGLGAAIAKRLGLAPADPAELAATSEVDFVLAGAARLAAGGPSRLARPGPRDAALTRDVLAPYVERALDRAAALQSERGMSATSVYARVLGAHEAVFGGKAAKPALRALRPSGEWTPLVAALSLHAAERLGAAKAEEEVLRSAAADTSLRLAIPQWHAAARSGAVTVAGLLAERHGAAPPEFPMTGRLFTAFGIPVRADLGFLLFAGFLSYQLSTLFFAAAAQPLLLGIASVVLLYVTLLGHEFGHALVARAFNVRTYGISLNFLGGAAHIEGEPRKPLAEFLIAAAGPAVNLVAAALLFPLMLSLDGGGLKAVLVFTIYGNILLGAMNLLPAYPMDGGRILRAGLTALLRDHYKATHITAWLGMALGLAAGLLGAYQVAFTGDWTALFTVMLGAFIAHVSRSALHHPGTELVEPAKAKQP